MADSLREQLIAAGLAPAVEEKKKRPARGPDKRKKPPSGKGATNRNRGRNAAGAQKKKSAEKPDAEKAAAAEIEARKKLKAQIKAIIETNRIEKWQGDVPYRYQVGTKLRELYVTSDIQKKLAGREMAITRLNGSTYIVPAATATEIVALNPLWTVFNSDSASDSGTADQDGDDYSQFEVPDDLTW